MKKKSEFTLFHSLPPLNKEIKNKDIFVFFLTSFVSKIRSFLIKVLRMKVFFKYLSGHYFKIELKVKTFWLRPPPSSLKFPYF